MGREVPRSREPCCARGLVTSTPKSHLNPKKSPQPQKVTSTLKSQKSQKIRHQKKINFLAHFVTKMLRKCSINPKKSKKVKKFFFIFHILCEKKSHLYKYF